MSISDESERDNVSAWAHQMELESRGFEEAEVRALWEAVKRGDIGAIQNLMLAHPSSGYQTWLDDCIGKSHEESK